MSFLAKGFLGLTSGAGADMFGLLVCRRVEELTDSTVKYGLIPREDWVQPDWIDEEKAADARKAMVKNNVIYGGEFWVQSWNSADAYSIIQAVSRMFVS